MTNNDAFANLVRLMSTTTLELYLHSRPPSHVVVVDTSMTIAEALALFHRHSILSAPLLHNERVVGFLDIQDVIYMLLLRMEKLLGGSPHVKRLLAAEGALSDTWK